MEDASSHSFSVGEEKHFSGTFNKLKFYILHIIWIGHNLSNVQKTKYKYFSVLLIKIKYTMYFFNSGSFEVQINGTLVHSKLSTLAYPDYKDLSVMIQDAKDGKPPTTQCKQQPITDCCIS